MWKKNARAGWSKDLPLPSIWDHISRLPKCLVVGIGPCSAPWSSFGGLGLRADWHGIEAIRMGTHMSVVVAASVSPRRRVCAAVGGQAGMAGLVEAVNKSVALSPHSLGMEWRVPDSRARRSRSAGQLTDDARCWRKSSQLPIFSSSGLASPYRMLLS